jgi:hypothetical protein
VENQFLDQANAREINECVARILADLGSPEPPLNLNMVRELLQLDKAYYSSADQGVLRETVHRLKIAGKQIVKRPLLLLDAIKKFDLAALWLPDRKRILIDSELPELKQRWGEAHEIGHSMIPWHEPLMHGDQHRTLSIACQQQVEKEANYAAGRLLFLQDRFVDEVRGGAIDFGRIRNLHRKYGNTMTATLWRTVESMEIPAVGLVSIHPREETPEGQDPVRHFLRSWSFAEQFASVTSEQLFLRLREFCYGKRGLIGATEIVLRDINGAAHVFSFECFHNSYDALTLGVHRSVRTVSLSLS